MKVIKGKQSPPWSIMIYGVSGIGKSSAATFAPDAIFLNLEDGLARIDCERSEHIKTFDTFSKHLSFCAKSDYKTIVIDTASALEDLLVAEILAEKNATLQNIKVESIADRKYFPYGEGGVVLRAKWAYIMSLIDRVKSVGKNVVMIAHESVQSVVNPDGEDYLRVGPNIHKKSIDLVTSRLDGVFYLHYERVKRTKENSITKSTYMTDTGERVLLTEERATAVAKNRFALPKIMPASNELELRKLYEYL